MSLKCSCGKKEDLVYNIFFGVKCRDCLHEMVNSLKKESNEGEKI